jgi:hypothetical protein
LVDFAEEDTMDKEAQLYSGGYVYVTIYYIIFVRYLASVDFGIHGWEVGRGPGGYEVMTVF